MKPQRVAVLKKFYFNRVFLAKNPDKQEKNIMLSVEC